MNVKRFGKGVVTGGCEGPWKRGPDDDTPDFAEFELSGDSLVFAFAAELFPRLEWGNFLTSLNLSHILFRDSGYNWYSDMYGIGGVKQVVEYMQAKRQKYSKLLTLGLSKGSWAALKFGKLAQVDRVIAISPNTGVGKNVWMDFPPEWHYRLVHDHDVLLIDDLKPLYASDPIPYIHAYISDGDGCELDRTMAERVRAHEITCIPGYTHGLSTGVAFAIRDNGILREELLTWSRS